MQVGGRQGGGRTAFQKIRTYSNASKMVTVCKL